MTHYLVETPWETRNLGVQSYALDQVFYHDSNFTALREEIEALRHTSTGFFIFARIEKSKLAHAPGLESLGFYVVECALTGSLKLNDNEILLNFAKQPKDCIPPKYKVADLSWTMLDRQKNFPSDALRAIAQESFSDDRFHHDYQCPQEIADRRFAYWVDDLIADEHVTFGSLTLEGMMVAFTAHKTNCAILGGFIRKYNRAGLGEFAVLSMYQAIKEQNYHVAETMISVNNLPILNLYARIGFKFKDPQYSFHYWRRAEGDV
jgi:hypothetical protein